MGILTGTLGRNIYGMMKVRLGNQKTHVARALIRATKDIKHMEKALTRDKQAEINKASATALGATNVELQKLENDFKAAHPEWFESDGTQKPGLTTDETNAMNAAYQREVQAAMANVQAQAQQTLAEVKEEIEARFGLLEETQLEPLKQEEENLTIEKENLETLYAEVDEAYKLSKDVQKAGQDDMKMSGNS